MRNNLSFWH